MYFFKVIRRFRQKVVVHVFYWFTRVAMSLTFIVSGIRKLPGIQFTILPDTNPVGAFFKAMHDTGFYWNSIGIMQIILGIMLFSNRLVVLTSLLMMPITINIFLVSIALQMKGTPIITTLMVLANIFLILRNYENFLPLLDNPRQ